MKYEIIEEKFSKSIFSLVEKAMSHNFLFDVFIGTEQGKRILLKDSQFLTFTDVRVFLEYGIYPVFMKGSPVEKEVYRTLDRALGESCTPITLYQVVSFFYEQKALTEVYEDLPVYFSFENYRERLMGKVKENMAELSHFREGEFHHQAKSLYEMISDMIEFIIR